MAIKRICYVMLQLNVTFDNNEPFKGAEGYGPLDVSPLVLRYYS